MFSPVLIFSGFSDLALRVAVTAFIIQLKIQAYMAARCDQAGTPPNELDNLSGIFCLRNILDSKWCA